MKTLIDVSYHNGVIDWGKAKQHIDGAIIRCGYGDNIETQDDPLFKENIEACIAHGIPVGVYLYSYAKTMEQAKSEAEHVIRLVGSYKDKLSYPVYYDLEEAGTETSCVENALVFGEILEREGFWVGIYASESWWNSYIGDSLNRFTKWVAKYGINDGNMQNMPGINNMDIWQYTSVGSVNGITGNVDMNVCYRDLPSEIRPVQNTQPAQRTYLHSIGEHVIFGTCYRSSTDPISAHLTAAQMSRNHGVITKIVDAANPYLLDDGLCWVNDGDIAGAYTSETISYYPTYTGNSMSITDALAAVGVDSSYANRKQIAEKNGVTGYQGTAEQNVTLLQMLKNGSLRK